MKEIFKLNMNKLYDNVVWGEISGLTYAYLEITRSCNCRCEYCQVGDELTNCDIDPKLLDLILEELSKEGTFEVRLGGGEPLLNRNLLDIIKKIKDRNMSVCICTNGTLITKDLAREFKRLGVSNIRVSIDSLIEEKQDKLRGLKGCYKRIMNSIEILKSHDLNVILALTLGKHNIEEVSSIEEFAKEKNIKVVKHFIMPIGKGVDFLEDNSLNYDDVREVADKIEDDEINCVAVTQSIAIDNYGNIAPCSFIKPIFNIKEMTLSDILDHPNFIKYTKIVPNNNCDSCEFNSLRCGDSCPAIDVCRGGCWALYEN